MTSKNDTKSSLSNEEQFFSDVSELLQTGHKTAYRSVHSIMIKTYWHVGKRIVEQEQHGKTRADYGEYLIVSLSRYLTDCFGKGFSVANLWNFRQFYLTFVARQMRVSTETSNFYVDLVLYNYLLKCFIIIDLKTDKLTHQDLGQMDMYVRMFDELKRGEGDNPIKTIKSPYKSRDFLYFHHVFCSLLLSSDDPKMYPKIVGKYPICAKKFWIRNKQKSSPQLQY